MVRNKGHLFIVERKGNPLKGEAWPDKVALYRCVACKSLTDDPVSAFLDMCHKIPKEDQCYN